MATRERINILKQILNTRASRTNIFIIDTSIFSTKNRTRNLKLSQVLRQQSKFTLTKMKKIIKGNQYTPNKPCVIYVPRAFDLKRILSEAAMLTIDDELDVSLFLHLKKVYHNFQILWPKHDEDKIARHPISFERVLYKIISIN